MLRDPALILWLDGQRNTRQAPNENLARELMELFTLGVGDYTEDDVKAGARALTGWAVDRRTGNAHGWCPAATTTGRQDDPGHHRRRSTPTRSPTCWSRQPAHAPFLAGRLWLRFASVSRSRGTAAARGAYAGAATSTAMLRALFTDPAFAGDRGAAGQAAGGVGGRRGPAARHRPADAAGPKQRSGCSAACGRSGRCRSGRRAWAAGRPARPG